MFTTETELNPRSRSAFQKLLEDILVLDPKGDREQVHFQPPANTLMAYPAIVYARSRDSVDFADNKPYRRAQGYTVTVIHRNPDNMVRDKIAELPYCAFDRSYPADGLNHDVFTIFF